jgi:hypothetical protein
MKLSIDNCCEFNGFMLLSQTRAEYLCCCASLSRRLGRQTFCGGTGTGEKAAECQLGLKDHRHPAIGQSLAMSDEFAQAQCTFLLQPQGMTPLWTQRIIEHNEPHAAREITQGGIGFFGLDRGDMQRTLPRLKDTCYLPADRLDLPHRFGLPYRTRHIGAKEVPCQQDQVRL